MSMFSRVFQRRFGYNRLFNPQNISIFLGSPSAISLETALEIRGS